MAVATKRLQQAIVCFCSSNIDGLSTTDLIPATIMYTFHKNRWKAWIEQQTTGQRQYKSGSKWLRNQGVSDWSGSYNCSEIAYTLIPQPVAYRFKTLLNVIVAPVAQHSSWRCTWMLSVASTLFSSNQGILFNASTRRLRIWLGHPLVNKFSTSKSKIKS